MGCFFAVLLHLVCCDGTLRSPGQVLFSLLTSDYISGSRSWISNLILQGMNQMMWSSENIPQGVSKELKCFMMKCDPFHLYLLLGEDVSFQLSAFSSLWEEVFWVNHWGQFLAWQMLRDLILYVGQPDPSAPVERLHDSCSVKQADVNLAVKVSIVTSSDYIILSWARNLKCHHVMTSFLHSDGWSLQRCDWLFVKAL